MQEQNEECNSRRDCPAMSDESIEIIAERAASKAVQKMADQLYKEIGKGFVSKFLKLTGVVIVGLAFWLVTKGVIKL